MRRLFQSFLLLLASTTDRERSHQALDNRPLTGLPAPEPVEHLALEDIVCAERLGGLLKHYTRRAG